MTWLIDKYHERGPKKGTEFMRMKKNMRKKLAKALDSYKLYERLMMEQEGTISNIKRDMKHLKAYNRIFDDFKRRNGK